MDTLTNKDLAGEMLCSVETLRTRSRILKFKPTFAGHNYHRWSRKDADKFFQLWSEYTHRQTNRRRASQKKPLARRK